MQLTNKKKKKKNITKDTQLPSILVQLSARKNRKYIFDPKKNKNKSYRRT